MASLKAIQTGSATILAASNSVNVTITAVVLAKSILQYTYKGNGANAPVNLVSARFTSTTNIIFERNNQPSVTDFTIQWTVIEFNNGIDVQRGTSSGVPGGTTNIAISAVTIAQSWATICYNCNNNFDNNGKDRFTGAITSTTNLRLVNNTVGALNNLVVWQVINYTNASVQQIAQAHNDTLTTENVAITSVPVNKTAVFQTFRSSDVNFNEDSAEKEWLPFLQAATNLRYVRGSNNGGAGWGATRNSVTYVVTFPDVKVTRFQSVIEDGDTSHNQTVAINSTSRSSLNNTSSVNNTVSFSTTANLDHPRWFCRGRIISTTSVIWDRQVGTNDVTVYFEILEWDRGKGFLMFFEPF